ARALAACLREALLGARERALPSFAPKRRELLVHQTQRALQRAVIVLHQAVRGLARRAAQVGMLEPRADRVRELRRVLDLLRGAALEREARDLLEVEHVRPEDHGHADRARPEDVLAAVPDQAAADERNVGSRVEPLQLPHRVADDDVDLGLELAMLETAKRDRVAAPLAEPSHGLEPLRMTRHDGEQQVRNALPEP